MRLLLIPFLLLTITLLILSPSPCRAQWEPYGLNLCSAPDRPDNSRIAPDGQGGAVIVWADFRHGTPDATLANIYAQRVDSLGNELWTPGGVRISPSAYDQLYPEIIVDPSGNAWIVFEENIPANWWEIMLQKLDPDGDPAWGGVLQITDIPDQQVLPMICSDESGGAIIAWNSGTMVHDLYCQRVDAGGNILWTPGGIEFVWAAEDQLLEGLVSDGSAGFIAVWRDYRYTFSWDLFAQHIDGSGDAVWEDNGVPVSIYTGDQRDSKTVADGNGGVIIVWAEERAGSSDIYAQGLAAEGYRRWSPGSGGVAISEISYDDVEPRIACDGQGGAIISWKVGTTGYSAIHARRLTSVGEVQWGFSGTKLNLVDDCYGPWMTGDGSGGVFVLWLENRYGAGQVQYCQRIDIDGFPIWGFGGVKVAGNYAYYIIDSMIRDSNGGIIITWAGDGILGSDDLYAQRLDGNGDWGYPRPYIRSVSDLRYDQGGYVTVAWSASQHDTGGELAEYTIWRRIDTQAALAMLETCADLLDSPCGITIKTTGKATAMPGDPGSSPESRLQLLKIDMAGTEQYWELVDSHPAYGQPAYARTVPTMADSMEGNDGVHYFQVIAHSTEPGVFWTSNTDSGYSIDNLAPDLPCGLAGEPEYNPPAVTLRWESNTEPDLACYKLYRGDDVEFSPSEATLIAVTAGTSFLDDYERWSTATYKLTAVDIHGNESLVAVLENGQITGDDPTLPAVADFLSQNWPNPFNPNTTIEFGLEEGGHVNLSIYDAAGRMVAELIDGERPAGRNKATWNGRKGDGSPAASGIYFYRLLTENADLTRKMILLR